MSTPMCTACRNEPMIIKEVRALKDYPHVKVVTYECESCAILVTIAEVTQIPKEDN